MSLTSLLILFLVPLIAFLIHLVGLRFAIWKNISGQKSAVFSIFVAMGVCFISFIMIEKSVTWASLLYFILLAPLLGHLYFQAFCLSETARRIRILVSIKKGNFSQEDLSSIDLKEIVQIRMERLLQLNQVTWDGNHYHSKRTLLTFVSVAFRYYERILFAKLRKA